MSTSCRAVTLPSAIARWRSSIDFSITSKLGSCGLAAGCLRWPEIGAATSTPQTTTHVRRRTGCTTSQTLNAIDPAKVAVERTEGRVSCLPGNLNHEAIGETSGWVPSKLLDRRGDDLGVLYGQVLVVQEHFDSRCDRFRSSIVDRRKHPRHFCDRQLRHPRPLCHERLGSGELLRVISCEEPDQHVGV